MPERFGLKYVNDEGIESRPIMIHRAILGSLERFIGTLIEHYGGAFPVWLAPTQVAIILIRENNQEYANKIKEDLQKDDVRVIIDARNESLNKRIREATVRKIPYVLILGDKEVEANSVAVRKYGTGDQGAIPMEQFKKQIKEEIENKLSTKC